MLERWRRRSPGPARWSTTCGSAAGDAVATVGKIAGAVGRSSRWPGRRAAGPRHPAQRRRSPPSAGSRSPAPSWRTTARSAPRTGAPSTTWCCRVVSGALRAWLLSRGEPVTSSSSRAGDGADVGARGGRRAQLGHHRLAGQPGLVVPRRPAGGRAEPGGAAAPRDARDAGAHGERAARRRRHAGADRRLRAAHAARAGRPRRQRVLQADLQPGGHERAGTAVPALRRRCPDAGDVPGGAAGQGTGPGDRPHQSTTAASTTVSTATATRCPTSTCWRAWWTSRSTSCWGTARDDAGVRPATWPMLRDVGQERDAGADRRHRVRAHAPKLREPYTSGDEEELEYAALIEAARASLRLLSVELGLGEGGTPARRVVVAADLEDVTLRPDLDDGAVRIAGPVPLEKVAAVHIDDEDAEYAVRQAARRSTPPTWATWTPSSSSARRRTTSWPGTTRRRSRTCWWAGLSRASRGSAPVGIAVPAADPPAVDQRRRRAGIRRKKTHCRVRKNRPTATNGITATTRGPQLASGARGAGTVADGAGSRGAARSGAAAAGPGSSGCGAGRSVNRARQLGGDGRVRGDGRAVGVLGRPRAGRPPGARRAPSWRRCARHAPSAPAAMKALDEHLAAGRLGVDEYARPFGRGRQRDRRRRADAACSPTCPRRTRSCPRGAAPGHRAVPDAGHTGHGGRPRERLATWGPRSSP